MIASAKVTIRLEPSFTNWRDSPLYSMPMNKIESKVTAEIAALWDYEFKIDYRYIMPQEDLLKLLGDFATLPGIKVKEVRRLLVEGGLTDVETTGEEDIDELVLNLPGEELDENGQGGFADRPLGSEPGRPPLGQNTRSFGSARVRQGKAVKSARPIEAILADLQSIGIEEKAVKLEPKDNVSIGRKLTGEQRPADTLADARTADVDAIVDSMQAEVLSAVLTLERGLLDHVEGKAFEPKTLVKRLRESESWTTFRNLLREALMRGAVQSISASAIHHAGQGIRAGDDLDYEEIAESVINRPDGLRGIVANAKRQVLRKVTKALAEGDEPNQGEVEAAVREAVNFWREHKAETVALTEAVEAYNEGTITIGESRGDAAVFVEDGHDHDAPCIEADGSVWPIDYARRHRTEHPRCRRSFTLLGSEA